MGVDETFLEVRDVSKGYFCLFCLRDSVRNYACTSDRLTIARSCDQHTEVNANKSCPCGKLWAHCPACMRTLQDPRAGTAICHRCCLGHGSGRRFCSCNKDRAPAAIATVDLAGRPGHARRRLLDASQVALPVTVSVDGPPFAPASATAPALSFAAAGGSAEPATLRSAAAERACTARVVEISAAASPDDQAQATDVLNEYYSGPFWGGPAISTARAGSADLPAALAAAEDDLRTISPVASCLPPLTAWLDRD